LILSGRVLGEDITRDHGFAVAAIVLGMAPYAI
jgi:hypothetical protein